MIPTESDANDSANHCAAGQFCINAFDEDGEADLVCCEFCLRAFHTYCAAVTGSYYPNHWHCFCHYKVDALNR